ncbi:MULTISPECIES: cytochrome c oxidase subunit II [Caldilinea]|jgi:cytochrome c oxidase subunit 2|uniref:Cytochrome c oxidase subunit 2 n=1 Tax=Caldilinea aerophila (strain DSM 14535 / JCM 11387 / NBRC 104270 / STL-6-O1) TaxID=926550 RepID=I0I1G4_CALAS|nr:MULTISPECIES: cytochrome c oxidase subunit II [Caldilinea]MBO9394587.1 cytochrome c oxidase subunit II [Caldilinea sp.]BAL99101.1 putative cytochrome c oxidase subunit II [Caldilinea aerophila DSM 14535 = NBRC 104270]GIV74307.1 MAG: cytochrome c oxidase subunit 2 [Caldilinea sp.]
MLKLPQSSTDRKHFVIVGALVLVTTIALGFFLLAILPVKAQYSVQAEPIRWLFQLHIWLIAFLFSLVVVFMLYALIVFRKRKDEDSEGEHFEGNTTLEVAWTVIPLVLVIIFSFIGFQTLQEATRGGDEIQVEAVGFQWAWTFNYPNGVTSPEMVLPVNKPALITLRATDVIHSFWVVEWGPKQDLVPGMTTRLHITPTKVGEFKVRCAELCGLSHWSMLATVRVVPEDEYIAWMNQKLAEQNLQTASR